MPAGQGRTAHVALSTTPDGVITSWNNGCTAMFGIPASAAIGQSLDTFLAEHARAVFSQCLTSMPEECDARNVHVIHPQHGPQEVELHLIPSFGPAGEHTAAWRSSPLRRTSLKQVWWDACRCAASLTPCRARST